MAITPQAIKDQEFQAKFRGYDPLEVKAYLEMVADEFFELSEQIRQQVEQILVLVQEKEDLAEQHALLSRDMETLQGKYDQLLKELEQNKAGGTVFQKEIDALKTRVGELEQEVRERNEKLDKAAEMLDDERRAKERLNDKLIDLEEQWSEQRKAEIDFKETLMVGQKFANDLKRQSEEEAARVLETAKAEADKLRQETFTELARYPKEIERLKMKRNQVREELRTALMLCLDNLDVLDAPETDEEDYSELFQKVELPEDGGFVVDDNEGMAQDMAVDPTESLLRVEDDPESFRLAEDAEVAGVGEEDGDDGEDMS